jgi:hypothetical protein
LAYSKRSSEKFDELGILIFEAGKNGVEILVAEVIGYGLAEHSTKVRG